MAIKFVGLFSVAGVEQEKRLYNRETIVAFIDEIQQMSFYKSITQISNPFLNARISAQYDKVERLSTNDKLIINGIVPLL